MNKKNIILSQTVTKHKIIFEIKTVKKIYSNKKINV